MTLFDLRTENQTRPLGLGEFHPRFSWKVRDAEPNYLQRTRRVQVSRTPHFEKPFWDSRVVRGGESHLVPYRGPALEPKTRYWFRVRVVGKRYQSSGWSEPEWFETAIPIGAWSAPFISPLSEKDEKPSRTKVFKREFDLPFAPVSARVYATALGMYEMTLNAQKVSDTVLASGLTAAPRRLAYQTYDVTGLVRQGTNTLEALVGNLPGSRLAFSALLEIQGDEGRVLSVVTDEFWLSTAPALTFSDHHEGEIYDARREGKGRWTALTVLKTPDAVLFAQADPPVKRQECLKATLALSGGDKILDFGQNLIGWVRFSILGKPGDKVVLSYAETLDAKGNFPSRNQTRNRSEYILKGGGPEQFEPRFSFQAFRYVRVEKWPGEVDPGAFEAVVLHSAMEPTPQFVCSQPGLNQWHRGVESARKSDLFDRPAWTGEGASVIVPWSRWRATGDFRKLEESWPSMKAWGEFIRSETAEATPDDFVSIAFYAYSVGLLARSARVLGKDNEAKTYKGLYKKMVEAFRHEFLTPGGRLAVPTQTASILALEFDLIPVEFRDRVLAALVTSFEQEQGTFDRRVVGTTAFCDVLTRGGFLDLAYDLLLKEADLGSVPVTEGSGDWMYRTVGGIELDPEVSGYRRIVFHPQPGGGITWARSSLETPYGVASLAWSFTEETWNLEIEVPPNTTAVLVQQEGRTEYGSGKWSICRSF